MKSIKNLLVAALAVAAFAFSAGAQAIIVYNVVGTVNDGSNLSMSTSIAAGDPFASITNEFTIGSGPALDFGGSGIYHYNPFAGLIQGGVITSAVLKKGSTIVATGVLGNLYPALVSTGFDSFNINATSLQPGDVYKLIVEAYSLPASTGPANLSVQGSFVDHDRVPPTEVPEPGTLALVGLGSIGLLGISRRRKTKS